MDKKEFRVLIKYCFLKGKNTLEAKTWINAQFPDTIRGKSTIKDWYAKFRRGEMSTEDGELSGRPKQKDHQQRLLHSIIGPFEGRNRLKMTAFEEKESAASPRQCTVSKIHELGFELFLHPPYSPDLNLRDYSLFVDLKRMFTGNKLSSNQEVIDETEAYFEAKDKSYYKNGSL
ncbi:hypothetical protein GWI33_014394 [Rhynchophorus ferrugineus]|uniref:Mos1 transposase HTH domain-containing protein n=1 Tax=Rhynchophorus ferrugineus TaxID=354439 RepID=A0A834I798_RHYFE|nr:hypothetical protein GWI33_014394 [Rhynchophorus ferrugineus]